MYTQKYYAQNSQSKQESCDDSKFLSISPILEMDTGAHTESIDNLRTNRPSGPAELWIHYGDRDRGGEESDGDTNKNTGDGDTNTNNGDGDTNTNNGDGKVYSHSVNNTTCNLESGNLNSIVRIHCRYDEIYLLDLNRTSKYLTPTLRHLIIVKRDYSFARNLNIMSQSLSGIINFLCTGYLCIDLDTLVITMEKLGGSQKLDQYLLKLHPKRPNCPSEDVRQMYQWRIASMDSVFDQYTVTQAIHPNSIQFWFRKLKHA